MKYDLHRWEYSPSLQGHTCMAPTIRPFKSERCPGCGAFVSDRRLQWFVKNESCGTGKTAALNVLGSNLGVGP